MPVGTIQPRVDVRNLVRELADNKLRALELIREALSNAKDHGAQKVYVRTTKSARNEISVLVVDDGEGMDNGGLEAFWGIGASHKPGRGKNIGYKGHGTKLFFGSQRLTVATRVGSDPWRVTTKQKPSESPEEAIDVAELTAEHPLYDELKQLGLTEGTGTAIFVEELAFSDATELLSRGAIESYCDWFTVIGDVRSGLYDTRKAFHDAVRAGGAQTEALRTHEGELRALTVYLRANGESEYSPLGFGRSVRDKEFLQKWADDIVANKARPGLAAFGHRFADQHESGSGSQRVRDDTSAIRLTGPEDWVTDDGICIVARVEGHRRQRETYAEASWQHKQGLYSFDDRFGLWLCRNFIPITQRNDLLRKALDKSSRGHLQFDFGTLRNWQVFINDERFLPTANRNDVSNQSQLEPRFVEALVEVLTRALKMSGFLAWVDRLRRARHERQREKETKQMDERRSRVEEWIGAKRKRDAIDPMDAVGLKALSTSDSLEMRAPTNEQELFFVYGLLSARYQLPIQVLDYDASQGVDAIGRLRDPKLVSPANVHARVEFKFALSANNPIDHYFEAIDLIVCWKVDKLGAIYEESSSGDTIGTLQKRTKSVTAGKLDTHEIVYESVGGKARRIPVLQLRVAFPSPSKRQ